MTVGLPLVEVYDATGATALGYLAGVEDLTASDVFCDLGSLQFSTTRDTTGASLIEVDADRQLKLIQPSAPDLWFLVDEDSGTYVSDDPARETIQFTCRSLAGVFDEAVVIPSGGIGVAPAEWAFTAATPGKVVYDLFGSAQSRGLCEGITLSGTALVDAGGDAWPSTVTTTYRAGTTLLSVLTGLAKALLLEWRMNGRALEIYKPGGDLDRTLTTPLRPGGDVLSAPLQRSRRSVATAVVLEGTSGATVRRTQTLTGRRAREVYVSKTEVASGSLAAIGDLYLAAHDEADVQISHDLTGDTPTALRPWVDYRPGDRIPTAAASATGVVTRRIKQVAARWADSGTTVGLELGSLLDDAQTRMDAQLRSLLPGAQSL